MRSFVNVSWNNASDVYDGSQQQNKHFNPNGTAATHLYADEEPKGKAKPKSSIMDKIDLANRHLNRLELMSAELEHDFDSGRITLEAYARGRRIMDERLKKAWDRVAKQEGWDKDEEDVSETEQTYAWTSPKDSTESKTATQKKDSIFLSLSVDNSFRKAYDWFQKAKNLFRR